MTFLSIVCVCVGEAASRCVGVHVGDVVWGIGTADFWAVRLLQVGVWVGKGEGTEGWVISCLRQTPDQIRTTPFQFVVQLVHCFPRLPLSWCLAGPSCAGTSDPTGGRTAHQGRGGRRPPRLSCRCRPRGGGRQMSPGCCRSPAGPPLRRRQRWLAPRLWWVTGPQAPAHRFIQIKKV